MQTGRDKAVKDFLKAQPDSQDYLDDLNIYSGAGPQKSVNR